jgi:hypothetical protein
VYRRWVGDGGFGAVAALAAERRGARERARFSRRVSLLLSAAWAGFIGLLPHVLHHAGPLAGAALFAGAGGSILFGAIGLAAAIPFMLRLRRRTGGWPVPAGVLALMAVMFSISTLVIGPKLTGGENGASGEQASPAREAPASPGPAGETPGQSAHEAHH